MINKKNYFILHDHIIKKVIYLSIELVFSIKALLLKINFNKPNIFSFKNKSCQIIINKFLIS